MGSVAENLAYYGQYDWRFGGSEWSIPWGSTDAMWEYSLLPRLRPYLPASKIVEIGAGHGRVSRCLRPFAARRLYLYDIMQNCVDACSRVFVEDPDVRCIRSDGNSLPGIDDQSIDLIVSFYSLVHADNATIAAYTREIARVLETDGVAFIHHSNAGIYYEPDRVADDKRMELLAMYRDVTMSAERMRGIANANGLVCIHQECINWDVDEALTDCFSIIARGNSPHGSNSTPRLNLEFRREMESAARANRRASR